MPPERPTPLTPYSPYTSASPILQQPAYSASESQQPTSSPLAAFPLTIKPVPLTASAFAPYGTVISTPLAPNQDTIPYPSPQGSLSANQGSALKYPSTTPPTNSYHLSPSGAPATASMSVYSCFPRPLGSSPSSQTGKPTQVFEVRILERHPYTTQTFIPFASSSANSTKNKPSKAIIIVAPSLPPPSASSSSSSGTPYFPQATSIAMASTHAPGRRSGGTGGGGGGGGMMPDLRNMQAFVADVGQQGVMYGAGTWHTPMVVVGERRVDFVVSQWMSGREGEDCQEVEIAEGICIDLGEGGDGERDGLWKRSRL